MRELKQQVLGQINSNIEENLKARESLHGRFDRVFALANGRQIRSYHATERGAESRREELRKNTYISPATGNLVSCDNGYKIIKIEKDELTAPTSADLWFETMEMLWEQKRGGFGLNEGFIKHNLKKIEEDHGGYHPDLEEFIGLLVEDIKNGKMRSKIDAIKESMVKAN